MTASQIITADANMAFAHAVNKARNLSTAEYSAAFVQALKDFKAATGRDYITPLN